MGKKLLITGVLGLAILAVAKWDKVWGGGQAKDFTLMDIDGKPVTLSSLRGRPVVVCFYFLGCPPCRAELPHLSMLAEKYKARDLTVLAINVRDGETPDMVREFAQDKGIKLRFLQDGAPVAMDYGVRGVPASFFVDVTGAVEDQLVGFNPMQLEASIQAILPGS